MDDLMIVESVSARILERCEQELNVRLDRYDAQRVGRAFSVPMVTADGVVVHAFGAVKGRVFLFSILQGDEITFVDNEVGADAVLMKGLQVAI